MNEDNGIEFRRKGNITARRDGGSTQLLYRNVKNYYRNVHNEFIVLVPSTEYTPLQSTSVVDPDPHGSTLFWPPGSVSRYT